MKRILTVWMIVAGLAPACIAAAAGVVDKVITDDGRTATLYDDGTWEYEASTTRNLQLNVPDSATSKATDKKSIVTVQFDPSTWVQYPDPGKLSPDASLAFAHQNGDAYAIVIIERISIPIESLKKIVLENARQVGSDTKIVHDSTGTVNEAEVTFLDFNATISEIPFRYHTMLWSGNEGSVQVIAFTSQNLFPEYKKDFDGLLSGTILP